MKRVVNAIYIAVGFALSFQAYARCEGPFTDPQVRSFQEILTTNNPVIIGFCQNCDSVKWPAITAPEPFQPNEIKITNEKVTIDGEKVDLDLVYIASAENRFANAAQMIPKGGKCSSEQSKFIELKSTNPYPNYVTSLVASVRKWVDLAGNCTGPMKSVENKMRDALLLRAHFEIFSTSPNPMRPSRDELLSIDESAYYNFVSAAVKKSIKDVKPYCDEVASLAVPPNLATEAMIRERPQKAPLLFL